MFIRLNKMSGCLSAQWFVVPAVCLLVGLLSGIAEYFFKAQRNETVSVAQVIFDQASYWLLWALLSPLIYILVRGFPLERPRFIAGFLVHTCAAVAAAILSTTLFVAVLYLSGELPNVYANSYQDFHLPLLFGIIPNVYANNYPSSYLPLIFGIIPNVIIYWVFLGITLLLYYQRQYREELVKSAEFRAQLSDAKLQALKMQLHPHFLFNTLHSISAMMLKNENREAVKMVNRLSDFLRLTLDKTGMQIVPLRDELEFAERYLEIERVRFSNRLRVETNVDAKVLDAAVPNLILQPLIENAVRHGIAPRSKASRIEIVARLEDNRVCLEIRDDGGNLSNEKSPNGSAERMNGGGLGLKNSRARLTELYGENFVFDLFAGDEGETTARIVLPFVKMNPKANEEAE